MPGLVWGRMEEGRWLWLCAVTANGSISSPSGQSRELDSAGYAIWKYCVRAATVAKQGLWDWMVGCIL